MSERCILAIDLGTSGPKVSVVGESGAVLGTASRAVEMIFTPDGGTEHDPEAVWRAVCEASTEVVANATIAGDDVRAVICASHYFSLVPVDAQGSALMNIIVWTDLRASREDMRAFKTYRRDSLWRQLQWVRIHGIPPIDTGADNVSRVRWIQLARPDVYEKTAQFLEPMDYIALRLTGRATSNQCASFSIQLMDNRRLESTEYNDTLIKYSGIDREKLAELVEVGGEVGTVLPHVADALGIGHHTIVHSGLNDTQAAALGCGAYEGERAGIGIGTSSVMFSHTDFKKTDIRTGIFTQPSPVPNTYTLTAENGIAGKALEHFLSRLVFARDHLGDHSVVDQFATLDAAVNDTPPGANGVVFLPWVGGAMAPISDGDVRGGFLNIGLQTTRDDMARGVLEGVALGFRWLRDEAQSVGKRSFDHFVFYGGGARSTTWPQILADVLQVPVHRLENPTLASGFGVAALARVRLGWSDYATLREHVSIQSVFDPNAAYGALYEDRFDSFKEIFKRNRAVFRRLNRNTTP